MHLMKDHEGYIMYGDAIKAGKNPEKLLSNAFNVTGPLRCECTSINYSDYVRNDVNKTKEVAVENTMLAIKDVIFNPPATIVFWGDGSKTVVKCQDGEEFDPEKGLAIAFFKKARGNKGHYFEEIKKWTHKYAMSLFKDEVHIMKDEQIEEVIEAGMSKPTNLRWAVFYARAFSGDEYTKHSVTYKHKSSARRAMKRLLAKLPDNVKYVTYIDCIEVI